ncbi:MAG: CocE/NonD family hydrolase [Acidobacteria bacterium]|nr:CocE/NonD family hydrolase [Acidobacteriota bacterium]
MKRKTLIWLLMGFAALALTVPPAAQQQAQAPAQQSFLPSSASFTGRAVRIPMRDGQSLAADIYLPKTVGKFPVVLVQTPYNKDPMHSWWLGEGRWGANSIFTDSNYAFVVVDWRGKFASQNAQVPGKPPNIGQDGFDAIDWITKQEWSNGKVTTWGLSALGRVQYETARENPPNLVCAVPIVMPLNLPYDTYFPGGVLWEEFTLMLGRIGFGTTIRDNLAARPLYDDAYKAAESAFVKGEDIRVPALFIGGWYDIYTDGVIAAFQEVRTKGGEKARLHSRLIMGPWVHNMDQLKNGQLEFPAAHLFAMKKTREFMDYWVRGIPNGFDKAQAPITYFQMGANEWRTAQSWPPQGSRDTEFFLGADKTLAQRAPKGNSAPLTFRYDPANPVPTVGGHVLTPELQPGPADQRDKVEGRSDVLVFSTPALDKDLAIAGKVKIKLFVSSDRPDTDFTAILTDVHPDGRSMSITEGIRRMRLRNSTSKVEFIKPGEVYPVTIDLSTTALTFLKGHRIRLIVSSSIYPKYALNLNDDGLMYRKGTGQVATNSVYVDKKRPSALILPVVGR